MAGVSAAVLLFVGSTARAAPETILCDGSNIGTIDYANYRVEYFDPTASQGPPDLRWHVGPKRAADTNGGARFNAQFNFTGCPVGETLRPGTTFQWLQIVRTNSPSVDSVRGTAPTTGYIDPWGAPGGSGYEDLKPFYLTDAELADPDNGGNPTVTNQLKFFDRSQRQFAQAAGGAISWSADLMLVCTWTEGSGATRADKIHPLGYYTWGWNMDAAITGANAGTVQLNPTPPAWTTGSPEDLESLLGSASEFGMGSPPYTAGYRFQYTMEDCCIPVPEPASAGVVLIIGAALAGRRRRAA